VSRATTEDLLLEAAYFDPVCIRRTSRRLGLISDSSFRFERGVDPQTVLFASALAQTCFSKSLVGLLMSKSLLTAQPRT